MKRSLKLALSLVLAAGAIAPALAQDNFPDVPQNHWAYDALRRMKQDGLLVGYPDGLFRGGRPASRYELAVAMHAVYTNLKNVTDGLDAQIKALQGTGGVSQGDVQALRDAIAALQADLAAMRGYGDDIAALKRAAEVFDRELKSLGVDVESMKKDLVDLAGRVSALENKRPSVEISGDVNLLLLAGNSSGHVGLTQEGRFTGVSNSGALVGLQDDVNVLHEAAFTFTSTKATGPKFTGTAVIGNMISATDNAGFGGVEGNNSFGSQSTLPFGRYSDGVADDIYIQNLEASFAAMAFGVGFDIQLGRLNHKVDEYMFQRPDTTSYYSNDRWDNGKYAFDGAKTNFKLFGANLTAFGGRTSERNSLNGVDLNQIVLGNNRVAGSTLGGFSSNVGTSDETINAPLNNTNGDVDRVLGVQTALPLTKFGNLNLAYLWMDSDSNVTGGSSILNVGGADRLEVFGGDVDFTLGRIKVSGGLHGSTVKSNSDSYVSSDNTAFNVKVGYAVNKFALFGEYREIEENYVAPGDWGRLGILRNPGNIRGFRFGGSYNISDVIVLSGSGEIDTGLRPSTGIYTAGANQSPFDGDSEINNYAVRLDYKVNPNFAIYGSYENTRFSDLNLAGVANGYNGGTAKYRYSTLGLGYGLSETAKINLSYQVSDVRNEAFIADSVFSGGRYQGGLLTTQLTVKF